MLESQELGNLDYKYTQKELLNSRLTDYSYLGYTQPNGEAQHPGLAVLDFFHPEFLLEAGYLILDDSFEQKTNKKIKYRPNPFSMSEETIQSARQKPENKIDVATAANSFMARLNTRYPLRSASVYLDLYIDSKATPERNLELEVIEKILAKRLRLVNEQLSPFESQISTGVINGGILINIDSTVENIRKICQIILERLFGIDEKAGNGQKIEISVEEKEDVLDEIYSNLDTKNPIMSYSMRAFNRYVKSEILLTLTTAKKHLRKLDQTGIQVPKFRVGRLYSEGYVDNDLSDYLVNYLALKIDENYDPQKNFNFDFFDYDLTGFEHGKTVVLGVQTQLEEDPNQAYLHIFKTNHKQTEKLFYSKMMILESILYDTAFDYLRTQKQLGYVVDSGMAVKNGEIFVLVFVQTTEVDRARKEVEQFYREVEKAIVNLSDQSLATIKGNVVAKLSSPFSSVYSESGSNHDFLVNGLGIEFDFRMAEYIEQLEVAREDLLEAYLEVARCKTADKLILDSTLKAGQNKYSVGEDGYVDGEEFVIVRFED